MTFLITQPVWLSAVILIGFGTAISMIGPAIVRRRVGLHRLIVNNEVAGFKFAVVGVLYAVLLAFQVIVVWEKFTQAEATVVNEAGAVANIYRLAGGIGGESESIIQKSLSRYLDAAIADDWPAMERGSGAANVTRTLNSVYAAVLKFHPNDPAGSALLSEILRELDAVTAARRGRLVMAAGLIPGLMWFVLFSGAFITIGFTFFFGAENLRAQMVMTGALAALIFAELVIIIAIDHPFAGTIKVTPEALYAVKAEFAAPSGAAAGHMAPK
jgi:Protein of unknown function (DUF4239)